MANRLKIWNGEKTWEESEVEWDRGAIAARKELQLAGLKSLPRMVGIAEETAKNLKWKSLKYMVTHDKGLRILRSFLRHPIRYGKNFLRSLRKCEPYIREGDFFYYGVRGMEEFEALLKEKNTLFVAGFSYCHKPFECPAGRFTDRCIRDPENRVCRQCFIGKCMNALPEEGTIPLLIPTVHYVGEKIFDIVHRNSGKQVIFMITACEMTLKMFGDWGNMAGIRGVGVRLDGRICNTMRAFELSEEGIKPGLTVVLEETKEKMLSIIRKRSNSHTS